MKTKVYLRIGKDPSKSNISDRQFKVVADSKVQIEPLRVGTRRYGRAIPTVYMALNLDIPDEAFKPPTISATISVPIEKLGTAVEVIDPMRLL